MIKPYETAALKAETGDSMLRTDELTSILKNKHADLERYFEDCAGEMLYTDIGEYLCALLEKHGLRKTDLIFASGRERSYCYQILNGTRRNPSRDTLLAIALGLRFSLEETQTMLRIAGLSPLYPRIKRDAVILQQLAAGKTLFECNEKLSECGEIVIG